MKHGATAYQKHKCRCAVCREANAAHKRAWREKNRPADYPPHRTVRQWPLQPLIDAAPDVRKKIGVEWTSWTRALEHGLNDRTADHWAVRCGLLPGEVWPDWYDRGLHPGDDVFLHGTATAEPGWRQAAYPQDQPSELSQAHASVAS